MYRINTTESDLKQLEVFVESVKKCSNSSKKLTFTLDKTITKDKPSCRVLWSTMAYAQREALVTECDKEVGFNMVMSKRADNENGIVLVVEKLLVYPQTVSGAYIDTDEDKQLAWLSSLTDDEVNNMRGQGHSHVNMSVTPSATDEALYKKYIDMQPKDTYYYFCIVNKKREIYNIVYDLKNNICYENEDIVTALDIPEWVAASEWAKTERDEKLSTYSYTTTYSRQESYGWNGEAYGDTYGANYSGKYKTVADDTYTKKKNKSEKPKPLAYCDTIKVVDVKEQRKFYMIEPTEDEKKRFSKFGKDVVWIHPANCNNIFHAFVRDPELRYAGWVTHIWTGYEFTLTELSDELFSSVWLLKQ